MTERFEKFVAIDWSGAKSSRNKGLKVASCEPGDMPPTLEKPPSAHQNWSRTEILQWIVGEAQRHRILAGFDFAFAYPYCDRNAYFPHSNGSPKLAKELWQTVESLCQPEESMYGGFLYRDPRSPFYEYFYFWHPKHREEPRLHFDRKRLRQTDLACSNTTRPSCPFKCFGADQVGSASAAGMRALYFINRNYSSLFHIWPFEHLRNDKSILVEIFPRLFLHTVDKDRRQPDYSSAVGTSRKQRDYTKPTDAVLEHFKSRSFTYKVKSEDERDAIISAAAIRNLSPDIGVWHPEGLDEETRLHEGWIFGVR